jgi:hypothetical protein
MSRRPPRPALLLLACLHWPDTAVAANAPWYSWQNQDSERRVCAQNRPGPGWRKVGGPFGNAACKP